MALERSVIRWLYGRPLETLLATWGISLILIQAVRTIFGAQNVQVENPSFMSGGVECLAGVVLPWSRIVIIAFAGAVLVAIGVLLARTRLGLFVRGVTQNRAMASCVGVPTAHVDMWAFASARDSRASPAAHCRRSAMSVPTSARPTSSIPSWWWCWAGWGSSSAPSTRRWAWASPTSCSSRGRAR
jgi:urea transport system permease protein